MKCLGIYFLATQICLGSSPRSLSCMYLNLLFPYIASIVKLYRNVHTLIPDYLVINISKNSFIYTRIFSNLIVVKLYLDVSLLAVISDSFKIYYSKLFSSNFYCVFITNRCKKITLLYNRCWRQIP